MLASFSSLTPCPYLGLNFFLLESHHVLAFALVVQPGGKLSLEGIWRGPGPGPVGAKGKRGNAGGRGRRSLSKTSWWRKEQRASWSTEKKQQGTRGQGADPVSGRPCKGTRRWAWGESESLQRQGVSGWGDGGEDPCSVCFPSALESV